MLGLTLGREAASSITMLLFTYPAHLTFSGSDTEPQIRERIQTWVLTFVIIWQEQSLVVQLSDLSIICDMN